MSHQVEIDFEWNSAGKLPREVMSFINNIRWEAADFNIRFEDSSKGFTIVSKFDDEKIHDIESFLRKYKFRMGGMGSLGFRSYKTT